jgi:hypothetical protein
MKIAVFAVVALLTGCALQTEALQVDTNTFQTSVVASPARGGVAGAQEMALRNANKKCTALGKSIHVKNIETGHDFPAAGRAVVTFECT